MRIHKKPQPHAAEQENRTSPRKTDIILATENGTGPYDSDVSCSWVSQLMSALLTLQNPLISQQNVADASAKAKGLSVILRSAAEGTNPMNSVSGNKGASASCMSLFCAAAAPKTFCSGKRRVDWSDIEETRLLWLESCGLGDFACSNGQEHGAVIFLGCNRFSPGAILY